MSSVALCGQTQKQPVEAAGQISSDGREPAVQRLRGLHHRPGGDGAGVDRPAVRGPEAALAVGARGQSRGLSLSLFLSLSRINLAFTGSLRLFLVLCLS